MFKNRKLVIRLEKDSARDNVAATTEEEPTFDAVDYALLAESAAEHLGKKLLIGAAVMLVTTAVVVVLANAADTALQSALTSE